MKKNNFAESIAIRNMKDGSTSMLSETRGVKVREETYINKTIVSLYRDLGTNNEKIQREYISELWETVITDHSMPIKWNLSEFYINVEYRLRFGTHFLDWGFSRNTKYRIKHILIISPLGPEEGSLEGWSFFKENKNSNEFIYYFEIYSINKIIFIKT